MPQFPVSSEMRARPDVRRPRALVAIWAVLLGCQLVAPGEAVAVHDPVGIVRFLDTDADGRLDRWEVRGTPGEAAFVRLDTDSNGALDACELGEAGLGAYARPIDRDPALAPTFEPSTGREP